MVIWFKLNFFYLYSQPHKNVSHFKNGLKSDPEIITKVESKSLMHSVLTANIKMLQYAKRLQSIFSPTLEDDDSRKRRRKKERSSIFFRKKKDKSVTKAPPNAFYDGLQYHQHHHHHAGHGPGKILHPLG